MGTEVRARQDCYYRWTPPEIKPPTPRPGLCTPTNSSIKVQEICRSNSAEVKPLYLHPGFHHTTHSVLQVCDDSLDSPQDDEIKVQVFDPFNNIRIPLILKSTDTTDTLIKKCVEQRPDMGQTLNLVFNGKPVPLCKSLGELGVKSGAVFITFHICIGG